jgi:hypothetical protein
LNIDEFRGTKQWEGSTPICDSSSVLQKFFNSITNSVLLATGGSMSNMTELEDEHAISGDQELEQLNELKSSFQSSRDWNFK